MTIKSWMELWTENNVALTQPYLERKACSKFGQIPSSCLGGDSVIVG